MRRSIISLLLASMLLVVSRMAHSQPLQLLWVDPTQGPICAGPLGPGPCQIVARWIATHGGQSVGIPLPNSPPSTLQIRPGGLAPALDTIQPLDASILGNSVAGAAQCAQLTGQSQQPDIQKFLVCTRGALALNKDSATLVSCVEQANGSTANLAECAGRGIIGSKLTTDQMKAVNCATKNAYNVTEFAGCIASGLIASQLNPQQLGVLNCAANNGIGTTQFAGCAAQAMLGSHVSTEASAAIDCAVRSGGDYQQFGGCAANKFLQLDLNSEQQIAVQCVMSSGGQPYVAAGCAASRLTALELTKCVQHGIGGEDGCFGNNNDLFGRNGFVVRNIAALGGGPNSVIRDPGGVLGGPNSVFNNPRQLLGGPNSFPNQLLHNVPSPPPIEVGKIGNHRVCIPWC